MKTVLRFMKPYKRLCFFTLLVTVLDVAGGLLIPRLTADMVNIGVAGGSLAGICEMQYMTNLWNFQERIFRNLGLVP